MRLALNIIVLLTLANCAAVIKRNYAVTLKLINFSVPDGMQMNGRQCDNCRDTFFTDCDKTCDLEMTLCVEPLQRIGSGLNKCNGNSYNLRKVTSGSNEITFEEKRYGNWRNPNTMKFPVPFKGVSIKLKVVDYNPWIKNKTIDKIDVQLTSADFASNPGYLIQYNEDHVRRGNIAPTHFAFNVSVACPNGANVMEKCKPGTTTPSTNPATMQTTSTRATTTTTPAPPTYSVTLSLETFNDKSGTTYNGKPCDRRIMGYPACDLNMKLCIEPLDGSYPDPMDCSAGQMYNLGRLTTDLNAIMFLDNFGYRQWRNPATINFFTKGFAGVRVKFQIYDMDRLAQKTAIDMLTCDFDSKLFAMNSGKIMATKSNCVSSSKADTSISFTIQATCLQPGVNLSNCGNIPDYRVWFNWNSFTVPNTLASGRKCDRGIWGRSCDPQFKLCFEVLAHSTTDSTICSGFGYGQRFNIGTYNDQNTIIFDQNKVLPGNQWKNPGYVDFDGVFKGIMLKVYATDFDKDSTNDDPKTYEIDQFWMTFQPAELQLQTPHTIVHYRNYSKSGRDVEPTTYNFAIWAECLSGNDLMHCGV